MNLLIKFSSRERPQQFFEVLNKAQNLRALTETKFLITLDTNDSTMNNKESIDILNLWGNLSYHFGESKNKVDAINRDMDNAGEWDILLLLSDDMHPTTNGYDRIIVEHFEKHFKDTDGVLWMNDGYVGKKLNTIVCIGRKYYERFNFIYNPVYKSLFCDNEFTDISVKLNKFFYLDQILIEHRHPMNIGRGSDNLYRKNDRHFQNDKKLYFYRRDKI